MVMLNVHGHVLMCHECTSPDGIACHLLIMVDILCGVRGGWMSVYLVGTGVVVLLRACP